MVTAKKRARDYLAESDYWDEFSVQELWEMSEPVDDVKFVDARPKKTISIRLTERMIGDAKRIAKDLGMGYQTLFRMWLMEGLKRHRIRELKELGSLRASTPKSSAPPARRRAVPKSPEASRSTRRTSPASASGRSPRGQ